MISDSNSSKESFTLADGNELELNYFGDLMNHKAVVIIAAAMGVRAKFYQDLGSFLQEEGFLCVSFNYTGIDESPSSMGKSNYGMLDWAHKNIDFVINHLKKDFHNSKLIFLAHSAGGQMLGLCTKSHLLDKVITLNAGIGYWRLNAPALKRKIHLFWHFIIPVSIFFYGYFPGRKLKIVGNLPKKAAFDWRRACLKPNYLQDIFPEFAKNYANLKAPLVAFYPEDDDMLTLASIEKLNSQFINSNTKIICLTPKNLGVKHIGHMGLLKKSFKNNFWQKHLLPELLNLD